MVIGAVLIAHGLAHPGVFGPPTQEDAPWQTHDSWLLRRLGDQPRRQLAIVLSMATAAGFLVAGIALLSDASWWSPAALIACGLSLALLIGYFHRWLIPGILLDGAIIGAAVAGWPVPG